MAKKSKSAETAAVDPVGNPRMLDHYTNIVRPQLAAALGTSNPHAIPKLEKIVLNRTQSSSNKRNSTIVVLFGFLTTRSRTDETKTMINYLKRIYLSRADKIYSNIPNLVCLTLN
jgi:hypothetical protein